MTKYDKTAPITQTALKQKKVGVWIKHVQEYRKLHDVSFKVALKDAGATYTKVVRKEVVKGPRKPNPWMEHIKAYKQANPDWKASMSYKEVLVTCKSTYEAPTSE
jgi:hypothetical protein